MERNGQAYRGLSRGNMSSLDVYKRLTKLATVTSRTKLSVDRRGGLLERLRERRYDPRSHVFDRYEDATSASVTPQLYRDQGNMIQERPAAYRKNKIEDENDSGGVIDLVLEQGLFARKEPTAARNSPWPVPSFRSRDFLHGQHHR